MTCLFCKIVQEELPAKRIAEDSQIIIIEDIKPQAPFHFLILPKRHIRSVDETNETDQALLGHMILSAKKIAQEKKFNEAGYRLVFNTNSGGGQEVHHIHLHLLGGRQMIWPPG